MPNPPSSINLQQLTKAARRLPTAHVTAGETVTVDVPTRVTELNMSGRFSEVGGAEVRDESAQTMQLTFISVKYCRHPWDCWYEWELVL